MSDNEELDLQNAGSSDCKIVQAGSIKKGGYCMIKGNPCKIIFHVTSKPGKTGLPKASVVGIDIFTNKKYENIIRLSEKVQIPIVNENQFEVADIGNDDFAHLILNDGSLKQVKLPTDAVQKGQLKKVWEEHNEKAQVYFTVISAKGQEKIISGRWNSFQEDGKITD